MSDSDTPRSRSRSPQNGRFNERKVDQFNDRHIGGGGDRKRNFDGGGRGDAKPRVVYNQLSESVVRREVKPTSYRSRESYRNDAQQGAKFSYPRRHESSTWKSPNEAEKSQTIVKRYNTDDNLLHIQNNYDAPRASHYFDHDNRNRHYSPRRSPPRDRRDFSRRDRSNERGNRDRNREREPVVGWRNYNRDRDQSHNRSRRYDYDREDWQQRRRLEREAIVWSHDKFDA